MVKHILFPANPLNSREVDREFAEEAEAAKKAGFRTATLDLEILFAGGEAHISGKLESEGKHDVLYRGWLMKREAYGKVCKKLPLRMWTDLGAYEGAYLLPNWYPKFQKEVTPRTLVLPGTSFSLSEVVGQVRAFFSSPSPELRDEDESLKSLILKDFLKSAKHQWYDACYISDYRSAEEVARITKNFLSIQAENLTGGLCFREFVPSKRVGYHPKSRAPLVNEWRAFLVYGKVVYQCPYWLDGNYQGVKQPEAKEIEGLCGGLTDLPFVAIDFAERETPGPEGSPWVIFEVNDGGTAGIPEMGDVKKFYQILYQEMGGP